MTTPKPAQDRPSKSIDSEVAYQLGKLIGDVVEEIDRNLTLDKMTNFNNSLDPAKEDRLEWERSNVDTYESRSKAIDRKWKRY